MAYIIYEPQAALTPIANVDSGITSPVETSSGGTTTYPTPPAFPGMVVRAKDPTYGTGEFIMLAGVASTIVGSVVTYNTTSFTTALAPAGTNLPQPIAIAMSANVAATTWGWYQIGGMAVAAKTSNLALASAAAVGIKTTGLIATTGTGKEIQGALTAAKATVPKTVTLVINRPHMQGRVT
jgi:hypothetical protein